MLEGLLDLLLPGVCLICQRLMAAQPGLVCSTCWHRVGRLPVPRCARCGHPGVGVCHWCHLLPEHVAFARSYCWADDAVGQGIVHSLKYSGWHALATEMASRMARLDLPLGHRPPVVVPVPLAPARERERGYNQSERLAVALARGWKGEVASELLQRVRETGTQTRLTPEQRLVNVSNAFQADAGQIALLGDAVLVLVDDVITTGATMNACAAALHGSGAQRIGYLTFGRARDPRDARP